MDDRDTINARLGPGDELLERFVLQRCLLASGPARLWLARDRHVDSTLLVRIHTAISASRPNVLEMLKRDARLYRRVRHPDVARINDIHEHGDDAIVSIEAPHGDLLSAVLEPLTPMPYRVALRRARPIVEQLLHLHDIGGEHGRLDLDHLLVTGDDRWMLLPGDCTRPASADMPQLGRLLATLLTGAAPADHRPLNDRPERLDQGRTVPALLDQLASDLRAESPALRPPSMRDVLHRLNQLEEFIEASEQTSPLRANVTVARPPAVEQPPRRGRARVIVPMVLVGAALLLLAVRHEWRSAELSLQAPSEPPAAQPEDTPDARAVTGGGDSKRGPDNELPASDEPVVDLAELAAAKAVAEQALDRYLAVRREVDALGAAEWDDADHAAAAERAAAADAAFVDEHYTDAVAHYDAAAEGFGRVIARKDDVLQSLLGRGDAALAVPDSEQARRAFRAALLIDSQRADARIGLARAETLDELHGLLTSGAVHEQEGRPAFANVDYKAAVDLDPHSEEAAQALVRIQKRLADEQFQAMMSAGMAAFHQHDFDAARARLLEARQFRPAPEVDEALAMVEEARLRAEIERLQGLAQVHEKNEQWQAAWNTYRQVLAIDPTLLFAQEGKTRSEDFVRLEKHVQRYLDQPDLLIARGTREDAQRLVDELESTPGKGPKLSRASADLARRVRLANTPVPVVLRSDGQTAVDVYRVGRFGTFRSKELELAPGVYTVVGHRTGYKDVRLTLRIEPGATDGSLEVVCRESIR